MKLVHLAVNVVGFLAGLTWIFAASLFRHPAVPFAFWGTLPPLAAGLLTMANRGRLAKEEAFVVYPGEIEELLEAVKNQNATAV